MGDWRGFISLWELACKRLPALALHEKSPTGWAPTNTPQAIALSLYLWEPTPWAIGFVVGAHPVGEWFLNKINTPMAYRMESCGIHRNPHFYTHDHRVVV